MVQKKKKSNENQDGITENNLDNPKRDSDFVGRDESIKQIRNLLNTDAGKQRLLFIKGSGGLGKTAILKHLVIDQNNESINIQDLYRKLETARLHDIQEFYTLLAGDPTTDAPLPDVKKKKRNGK